MLFIHQLTLHHFRNYHFAQLEIDQPCVILTGPNGAGKTNILEAVSLLSPGRGMRKAKLAQLSPQGAGAHSWVVAAQADGLDGAVHLGTSLEPESARDTRLVKVNGEKIRGQAGLAEHLTLSWHTPQMDGLFLASDGERRRYLDRLVYSFDPKHLVRVTRYEHAMRERNKLLSLGRSDEAWLQALEETMAAQGAHMVTARAQVLAQLNAVMDEAAQAFPKAQLSCIGALEQMCELQGPEQAAAAFRQTLREGRAKDAGAGRALFGAHRSQLQVLHRAKNTEASYCSTGEQKALLMAILLAHSFARKQGLGAAPIILLDETVAHLDAARRDALAGAVRELGTQAWLTGTDAADFEAFEGFSRHFDVAEGVATSR